MRLLFLSLALLFAVSSVSAATPDTIRQDRDLDHYSISNDTVSSGNTRGYAMDEFGAQELNGRSSKMLLLEAQQALHSGDLENAMHKVKRSMELDDDDMDAHCIYADILDEQLRRQTEKDPTLYNKCVEEWLNIMRNRYGEEKGMRVRGISPIGDLYHDEERSIVAKRALVKLTGYSPKTLETDKHYLKSVLLPTTEKVSGAVVSSKAKIEAQ